MVCHNFRTLYIGESSRFSDFDDAASGTSRGTACQFAYVIIRGAGKTAMYYRKYFYPVGALIASLLGIDIKKSSLAILCGIAMATVIMYIVSYVLVGNIVS